MPFDKVWRTGALWAAVTADGQAVYEFSPQEEKKIATLANRTIGWGVVSLIISVLMVAAFVAAWGLGLGIGKLSAVWLVVTLFAAIPVLVVNGIVSVLYIGAGRSLRALIKTHNDDVPHVLDAMARLSGAFRVELIVSAIGILGGVAALVQGLAEGT